MNKSTTIIIIILLALVAWVIFKPNKDQLPEEPTTPTVEVTSGERLCYFRQAVSGIQMPGEKIGYDLRFFEVTLEEEGQGVLGYTQSLPYATDSNRGDVEGTWSQADTHIDLDLIFSWSGEGMTGQQELMVDLFEDYARYYYTPLLEDETGVYRIDGEPTYQVDLAKIDCATYDTYFEDTDVVHYGELTNSPETIVKTLMAAASTYSGDLIQRTDFGEATPVDIILDTEDKKERFKNLLMDYFYLENEAFQPVWEELLSHDLVGEWQSVVMQTYGS